MISTPRLHSKQVYSVDIEGSLDPKYKKIVISNLYGLIEGSIHSVVDLINKAFRRQGLEQPTIIAIQKDARTDSGLWAGVMDITIHYDNHKFSVMRDWLSEYEIDKLHPNYDDDWFYETDDTECMKRWKALYEQNNIDWKVT